MKEHPILMSGPMIRAILEGRKVMTRRVMNPQPEAVSIAGYSGLLHKVKYLTGDSLWVRETWQLLPGCKGKNFREHHYQVKDVEGGIVSYKASNIDYSNHGWKPSIYMPRWASRLTLEVTGVRVERVQDISEADARKEGVMRHTTYRPGYGFRDGFVTLWDEINGKRPGCSWIDNPWVWCVSFRRKD